ncbi:GPO family capsid scaffolding protein [Chromobacterium alkanivorans]|uniref:GPO family capsid scaffolding protein n=1 Tax=Chromobacterium alkanivorans TaxID=1071719 RepID=UPI001967DE67|nr:GPO family capsid scaffolding protein [Chromobacterium alkanivorans]MBN3005568.1 GPO family capsid scaffolding protein [Chromobacterium alkanivorans]
MAGKSKKFCIATEGATTDGRVIERAHLEQMAKNYSPKLYGARVNLEHIKGVTPDSPFKRYGDVLSLSTEEGDDGKLRLYAVIDPTEDLVKITTKDRQKVYTSCEINPKFADTGEAYLVGLAVTDDPASLGTEMLQFSATAKKSPLAKRKAEPDNLFSEAVEFTLEMEDEQTSKALLEGFSSKIKTLLGGAKKTTDANFSEIQQAVEVIADSQKGLLEQFAALSAGLAESKALKEQLEKLSADHTDLVQTLSQQPNTPPRDRTPGGSGAITTDC